MKIILLKDVRKIGKKNEVKNVADGYALNSLIPAGFALPATDSNLRTLNANNASVIGERQNLEEALTRATLKLKDRKLTMTGKANEKGHLFASVHKEDIIKAFEKETGMRLLDEYVQLDKHIKEIGDQELILKVGNKTEKIILNIVATK